MLKNPVTNFNPQLFPKGDVTQFFGSNPALYGSICTPQGCLGGHNGWDIVRPHGTPVMAVAGGKVVECKEQPEGYGKQIRILDALNQEWVYGHASEILVSLGQSVAAGQPVIKMGNTGFVVSGATPYWANNPFAGTHLHLGKRIFQPYAGTGGWNIQYASGDKGTILNMDNGFLGSVPFLPEDFEGYISPPKPSYRFLFDLEYGMVGVPVKELQDILRLEGVFFAQSTGNFYNQTKEAVKKFQKKYGIQQVGRVGPITRSKLMQLYP